MLNEEVSKEAINDGVRIAKEAFHEGWGKVIQMKEEEFRQFIRDMQTRPDKVKEKLDQPGKEMSVKELLNKDSGAQSIDVAELGIGDFRKIAKRYGMDFAVVKTKYEQPPKYTVFFRARDADTVERVMNEYAAKQLSKSKCKTRPSLLKALKKLKDIVAQTPRKEKEKRKQVER